MLLILIVSWFPKENFLFLPASIFNGLDIFFTVSGFLITTSLLNSRTVAEETGTTRKKALFDFFANRAFRILPLFYLTLLLIYYLNPTGDQIFISYYLTFTSNLLYNLTRSWDLLAHTWSLSAGAQLYIIWAFVMLFTPRKYLHLAIACLIFTGIASQLFIVNDQFSWILPFSCMDTLGIGSLLAWGIHKFPESHSRIHRIIRWVALAAFVSAIFRDDLGISIISGRTLTACVTVWAVSHALVKKYDESDLLLFIFRNPLLAAIGRMSFSFYLFHLLIPYFTKDLFAWEYANPNIAFTVKQHPFFWILQNLALLIPFSYLGYKLVELPFLKRRKISSSAPGMHTITVNSQ